MATSLAGLQERLPKVKPWVAVAILIAVLLGGYSIGRAWQYWSDSGQLANDTNEIIFQGQGIRVPIPDLETVEEELKTRKERLAEWKTAFHIDGYPTTTDPLLTIVDVTAQENGIVLDTMKVLDQEVEVVDQLQYQIQSLDIDLGGQTHGDIYRFLSQLQMKLHAMEVSEISLGGFGVDEPATAVVRLNFYIAPEPVQ